ncbi:hypothetical protein ACNQFZ_07270 [Schinkia sp. CFF1]
MLFKGFNQNNPEEYNAINKNEFEKQMLRINALEVHIKKLLEFEKQFRLRMYKDENKNMSPGVCEEEVRSIVDRMLSEKMAHHFENEKRMQAKIITLESQILSLTKGTYLTENSSVEVAAIEMNNRLSALEEKYAAITETQAELMKRVDELMENPVEPTVGKESNLHCLYIDKLYLDKYEQNNNFAQLGIKELSGALNIGATYGSVDIPKEVNEQAKDEMAKLKAEMEKVKKTAINPDPAEEDQNNEASAEGNTDGDDEMPFTDIMIDED